MNILWIEDFGGRLGDDITSLLNLYFKDFVNFGDWDDDSYSIPSCPEDLPKYCKNIKSSHCIHLCRHFFDYQELKNNLNLAQKIDAIIIDIRLDNGVDFNMPIPEWTGDKSKFHSEAGFYIFNDLVHLGFPSEKICLMTGESGKLDAFDARRAEIYFPKVASFTKNKEEELLRQWINSQATGYVNLRRGIIDGCRYLIGQPLRFDKYSADEKKPAVLDFDNYLAILSGFFSLNEPANISTAYKLFVRTLAHEWDEAVKPRKLNKDQVSLAFSWIMKMARNWSAHSTVFEQLSEQDVAFLFMVNMRAMFDLGPELAPYERYLLKLFNQPLELEFFKEKCGNDSKSRQIPLTQTYAAMLSKYGTNYEAINFHDLLNELQKKQTQSNQFLTQGLYQVFWFLTSFGRVNSTDTDSGQKYLNYQFKYFDYSSQEYLTEIGRHIYQRSFSKGESS